MAYPVTVLQQHQMAILLWLMVLIMETSSGDKLQWKIIGKRKIPNYLKQASINLGSVIRHLKFQSF